MAWCDRSIISGIRTVIVANVLVAGLALGAWGCKLFEGEKGPKTVLSLTKIACLLNKTLEISDDKLVLRLCEIAGDPRAEEEALKLIGEQRKATAAHQPVATCGGAEDAGAPDAQR